MASAVASNLPVPATVPYGWLSPRVSFSRDAAADDEPAVPSSPSPVLGAAAVSTRATPDPATSKDFIDFEFSLGGSATMLSADELFADGKLLPLRKAASSPDPEAAEAEATMPAREEPINKPPRAAAVVAADGTDPYAFSPRAPSCSSRWRELLGLKRAATQAPSPKPSTSAAAAAKTPARATNSAAAARSLKLPLQRNNGRFSLSSSSSSSSSSSGHDHDDIPRLSLDSADPNNNNPPRVRLVRSSQHRRSTSSSTRAGRSPSPPPPPPRCCPSADSPRMNLFGRIVFQGLLERSSSSSCSFHAASRSGRPYSSGVRVAPVVLNVPVCSRPVFGFFKDYKKDSTTSAVRSRRSSLRRKTPPQGWSGELARSSG